MLLVSKTVWVGDSATVHSSKFPAILNVAADLSCKGWDLRKIEYAQVGLIDGPGNEMGDYCAALLCLKALSRRHKQVLVCDHDGNRALVVALMHANLCEGQWRSDPLAWSHWPTWAERLAITCERLHIAKISTPHQAHITAFDAMPWGLLGVL